MTGAWLAPLVTGTTAPCRPARHVAARALLPRAALVLLLGWAAPATAQQADDGAVRSVLDAVYTEEQASHGESLFADRCSACHSTYEFGASGYLLSWVGATLDQLYRIISTNMPYDNPGGLPAEEYAAVLAYLLKLNGYPAGDADLEPDADALGRIRIEAKPAGGR